MNNIAGKRILANREEFAEMWKAEVSSSEMGYHFGCNSSTINIYAGKLGLERRYIIANNRHTFEEIDAEELERRCKEVQSTWDPLTEFSRRVQKCGEMLLANIAFRHGEVFQLAPPPVNKMFDAKNMNRLMSEQEDSRASYSPFNSGQRKVS